MLIEAKELHKIVFQPNLLIIDTRSFKEYSESHIPGAVNLDLFAFHWFDTSKKGLEYFEIQMKKIFSFVGITNSKKVIFYDEISGMLSARGVWMLMLFSHKNSYLLDGGLKKWKELDYPLETKTNNYQPENFVGILNDSIIADINFVKNNIGKARIIDARSKEEYEGTIARAARKGHIPSSENIDYNLNILPDGTFKSDSELNRLYSIPKNEEVITYCQGAYRAANTFLALKKIGFENVRVYLGSWGEWGNDLDLPVEK